MVTCHNSEYQGPTIYSIRTDLLLLNLGDDLYFNAHHNNGLQLCSECGHYCVYGIHNFCCRCRRDEGMCQVCENEE